MGVSRKSSALRCDATVPQPPKFHQKCLNQRKSPVAENPVKKSGVAIWAFHGDKDEAVPVTGSRDMIAALKQAGVKPEPKYTELPGVGHGSWNDAYNTAAMWDWMFAQRRQATSSKP